jgi:hypothetical protein
VIVELGAEEENERKAEWEAKREAAIANGEQGGFEVK